MPIRSVKTINKAQNLNAAIDRMEIVKLIRTVYSKLTTDEAFKSNIGTEITDEIIVVKTCYEDR